MTTRRPLLRLFACLILLASIFGCQQKNETQIPQDLDGKKEYYKEKQAELKALENELKQINSDLEKLDPSTKKVLKLVTIDTVGLQTFERYTVLQGNITADEMVNASSEIGGRLIDVYVREGQNINRGQLIAKIDLESVRLQIAEIENSLELARTTFERQKRLWDQNIGSEMQYLQAKSNKEGLEKKLASVKYQLGKQDVYSPSSGVVERQIRQAGEMTSPGAPIIQILNTYKVKAVVDAPESYLSIIKRGDYVDLYIPAIDKDIRARVSQLSRTIDPSNRTFKVEANLNNRSGELKPNLLAEMQVKDMVQEEVIVLPLELIQEEVGGKKYVFSLKSSTEGYHIADKRYIETGETHEGDIVITSGLSNGDIVVVTGARNLVNEEPIEIK